ncbi:bifunctional diaminohydroxyphosphoribosylaminopyrimidine deaminase/5-amino-6-(5-phosphoribosylamino)uracil reductase RibD [Nemorincola caseinilytica]|uniref:Riboflavin biosynthesis protein RibD n=1 Tax=Nemorincola caseinilytica TaxID=2054315 RepID=A0ABP8NC26_9BACT
MSHEHYMQRCLQLAQQAKGHTAPNPMVGAVLVHSGRVIGEGWHHHYGAAHAEVNCLDNVAVQDKHLIPESTMYVSLEPCAHQGLTPPCALRLVAEKVKHVVIANKDPFARVNGKGIAMLEGAGIQVTTGIMEAEGLWVNRHFFCAHTHKRPYVILKWAQTADGYIGTTGRRSIQISGPESMALSHKWRTEEGAIMVGHTTALNDDPRLTARLHHGKQPLRIALDRDLSLPSTHHLFDEDAATWIVNERDETIAGNVHYIQLPFDEQLLPALLTRLYDAHILSVIVEGGAALHRSFIQQGLWDEARVITSPLQAGEGLAAAIPKGHVAAYTQQVGKDTLQIYTRRGSAYSYIQGQEL